MLTQNASIGATLKNNLSAAIFQNEFPIIPQDPANPKKNQHFSIIFMYSLGYGKISGWI